eukprot:s4546_g5.t1
MSVSAEEVAKHNKDGKVLDVTAFLSDHPGGKKSIMMFAGKDATEEFDMLHDRKVIKKYGLDEAKLLHSLEHSVPTQVNVFIHDPRMQEALELQAERRHAFVVDNVYAEASSFISHLEATADANHRHQLSFIRESTEVLVGQLHNENRAYRQIAGLNIVQYKVYRRS